LRCCAITRERRPEVLRDGHIEGVPGEYGEQALERTAAPRLAERQRAPAEDVEHRGETFTHTGAIRGPAAHGAEHRARLGALDVVPHAAAGRHRARNRLPGEREEDCVPSGHQSPQLRRGGGEDLEDSAHHLAGVARSKSSSVSVGEENDAPSSATAGVRFGEAANPCPIVIDTLDTLKATDGVRVLPLPRERPDLP
jgi:hypothetical protein